MNGNCASFGTESVTDGTSNTAMISERLVGLYNWSVLVYPGNKLALRFLFNTSFTVNSDTLNAQEALLFLQTCKSIPATQSANISSTGYLGFLGLQRRAIPTRPIPGTTTSTRPTNSGMAANSQDGTGNPALGGYQDAITATSNHSVA